MEFKTFCTGTRTTYREVRLEHELINKFYEIRNPLQEKILSIPDGCVNIWFLWKDGKCQARLIGSALMGKPSLVSNHEQCFGIKFNAGVVPEVFLNDIGHIINNNCPVNKYKDISFMEKEVETMETFEQKLIYFLERDSVFGKNRVNSITRFIVEDVAEKMGNLTISELADMLGYSQHYTNQVFRRNLGMPIKQYSGIVRIQQAIYGIEMKDRDFIYENLGYYDQSHFIREFKRYTLLTPKSYDKEDWSFV
ncbi:AraC family transcriptional regulator [Lacrimispora sp. NSJ-141]|uniref:AraC family transcriptional regulator n=1 Tax=Lientehia hominis TaxID=2897778 RepID=A0AAP2RJG9_9FIRM|nr:AraC family transcriptional regulator [Lientehia hominis]